MRLNGFVFRLGILGFLASATTLQASPYASNVSVTGTTVNFILNEPADTLVYRINGGAPVALDATTKGAKTFNLGAPTNTFTIEAFKNSGSGFGLGTGAKTPNPPTPPPVLPSEVRGLRISQNIGGTKIISDDASPLTRFNSPRGVGVNNNPNTANFGTVYVSNSAAGALAVDPLDPNRTLGDGIYALRADGSDAFGQGDVARSPAFGPNSFTFSPDSANSPFRITVANNGEVQVSDYYDNQSNVWLLNAELTTSTNMLAGFDGNNTLPSGGNHGSPQASYTTGSLAAGNLVLYTLDEDLNSTYFANGAQPGGAPLPSFTSTPPTDNQSLWRYDIGSGPYPYAANPTRVPSRLLGGAFLATADFTVGNDGKFYTIQNRSAGNEAGIYVLSPAQDGTILWDSRTASREILGDPAAQDIITNVTGGIAVSPDQKWIATVMDRSDVVVMPMVNGIPDISKLLVIDNTTSDTQNQGRDIAFDAANNIHFVSSGLQRYRALSPGGKSVTTLSYNPAAPAGSQYSFSVVDLTGDFNSDRKVDGLDFLVWQANYGKTGALPGDGDANLDGKVDDLDLVPFNRNFGTVGPPVPVLPVASVPEPANWASAALAVAILTVSLRRERKVALAPARA